LVDNRLGRTRGAGRGNLAAEEEVVVPSICLWEVGMLAARGRIDVGDNVRAFLEDALNWRGVRLQEISPAIAVRAGQLPRSFPGDPADRLIVATALELGAPLATRDDKILASGLVPTIVA
jgi:PIN domain nuclease of toxin-antitoxin system